MSLAGLELSVVVWDALRLDDLLVFRCLHLPGAGTPTPPRKSNNLKTSLFGEKPYINLRVSIVITYYLPTSIVIISG